MKLRKEIWKPIRGYLGLYEISSLGRVKSLSRAKLTPSGKCCNSSEKILSAGHIGKDGYEFVYLRKDGQSRRFYVHRLVAKEFLPLPNSDMVNHKNGIKFDNRVENLEWCNRSENTKHAFRVLSVGKVRKIAQYDKNGNYIKTWANAYEAQEELGINHGNINSCVNKHRKTAGGYRWEAICV